MLRRVVGPASTRRLAAIDGLPQRPQMKRSRVLECSPAGAVEGRRLAGSTLSGTSLNA
jgi:hypothetical protein